MVAEEYGCIVTVKGLHHCSNYQQSGAKNGGELTCQLSTILCSMVFVKTSNKSMFYIGQVGLS